MGEQNGNIKSYEKAIINVLKGETQKNALSFASFLEKNNMSTGENHGTVLYQGEVFAYMHMDGKTELPGPWTIWPDMDGSVPDGFMFDNDLKKAAWANVNICADCGEKCAPGNRKTLYGKEFNNVCNAFFAFTDPNSEALCCLKKLMELRKHEFDSSRQK